MTHLNVQHRGEVQTPDGQTVNVPPHIVLQQRGPCLQVSITVAQAIAEQLLQQGQPVPQPISGIALVDTGASATCIDQQVAEQLQLPVVDVVPMSSASHASTMCNVYPAQIEIVGSPITLNASRAIGAALAAQGYVALIGRDVL